MNPKVSILIPVYNVSDYIIKCAESLFNQTFEDLEYIFVNDNTSDDSIEKLENVIAQFPKRKESVFILHHKSNQGLAATRKTGLFAAKGDYIAVVDSDDYIEPEMIELMYNKAISENVDIVLCDLFMEYANKTICTNEVLTESKSDYFPEIIMSEKINAYLCNKLAKRSLYLNPECLVPNGLNYFEDRHVMTRMFYLANKIRKIDIPLYHYVHYNPQAITKNKTRMHFENVVRFWNLLDEFLRKHNEYDKYKSILALPKAQSKVRLMIDTHSSQLRKEYAKIFMIEEIICFSSFTKGEKLMLKLVRYRLFGFAQLFHNLLVIKNKYFKPKWS